MPAPNTTVAAPPERSCDLSRRPDAALDIHARHAALVRTHTEALEGATLKALSAAHGEEPVRHAMQAGIAAAMTAYAPARRMTNDQIVMLAAQLIEEHPHETLADVRFFCRCVSSATYGNGETFGAIDVPMMRRWWHQHLLKKAEELEASYMANSRRMGKEWIDAANSDARMVAALRIGAASAKEAAFGPASIRAELRGMTVEELRSAWNRHKGRGRSLVLAEAKRRGLMGADAKAAQDAEDRRAVDRAESEELKMRDTEAKLFQNDGIEQRA